MIEDLDAGDIAEQGLAQGDEDPLSWFAWPSQRHADAFTRVSEGWEGWVRGPNQCAKTRSAAAWAVATCRRERSLAGVPIPVCEARVVGALLVPGYKQASESSIAAVRTMLGRWPHHVEMGPGRSVQAIRIRQSDSRSEDTDTWSRLLVLVSQGEVPEGMRLDFAWADEPPAWTYWDAIRGRGRANRPFPRVVTFTPMDKRTWAPIRADIKGHAWPGHSGKFEMHLRITDNRFLSREHIQGLEQQWAGTDFAAARLRGDWVDLTGACPFSAKDIARFLDRCRDPLRSETFQLGDAIRADVDIWEDHDPEESYLVVADPSSGAQDDKGRAGRYDPSCLYVVARIRPRLVARFNGYIAAERLGRLGATLGYRYGTAMLAWENNGGWGEPFYIGARLDGRHYPNPYVQSNTASRRQPLSQRLGWTTTFTNRGVIVGAVQTVLSEDAIDVPSRDAIESLSDVRHDHRGRPEAADGRHDEDMICLGMAAHILATRPVRLPPRRIVRPHERSLRAWRA